MVVRRKKKVRKLRGSKTHGWGSVKKHRGKGSKGGSGRAGMGKRGQQKLTMLYAKGELPLGRAKKGFKRHESIVKVYNIINVEEIEDLIKKLEKEGKIKKSKEGYELNLLELGYNKLLGCGKISVPVKITIPLASKKAIKKVEEAEGCVILQN